MQRAIGPCSPRIKHLENCIRMRLRFYFIIYYEFYARWMHLVAPDWISFKNQNQIEFFTRFRKTKVFRASSVVIIFLFFFVSFFLVNTKHKVLFCSTCWCNWSHLMRSFKSLEIPNTFQRHFNFILFYANWKHYSFIIVICPFPN